MVRWLAALTFIFALSMAYAPVSTTALAQDAYPTRPVKFLIPYPAAGTNDVLARIVGEKLQAKWGQPIVVENRTGGAGNIAAAMAWQAEPDGYTLLVSATPPIATNQSLFKQLNYKAEEFVPITNFGSVPNLIIVRKGLPVNSVSELIAYAKANPGKLVYGSQGAGNTPHLTANMFMNDHRHADGARAVSRRNAGAPGHAGGTRRCLLRQHIRRTRALSRRPAQGIGGDSTKRAPPRCPRYRPAPRPDFPA